MRLGGIGQELEITARAVGKILDLMGFRSERRPSGQAVASGYGCADLTATGSTSTDI
jgi:hypothetical protein